MTISKERIESAAEDHADSFYAVEQRKMSSHIGHLWLARKRGFEAGVSFASENCKEREKVLVDALQWYADDEYNGHNADGGTARAVLKALGKRMKMDF